MRIVPFILLRLSRHRRYGGVAVYSLYVSSRERAFEGLARQKARLELATRELRRYTPLYERGFYSAEQYQVVQTAYIVAQADYQIAESMVRQASLILEVVQALGSRGLRVPICKRKHQRDDRLAAPLLKEISSVPPPKPYETNLPLRSGSRLRAGQPDTPPPPSGGGDTKKAPVAQPEEMPNIFIRPNGGQGSAFASGGSGGGTDNHGNPTGGGVPVSGGGTTSKPPTTSPGSKPGVPSGGKTPRQTGPASRASKGP